MRCIALIDGKKGAYGMVVPDLPGCTAMGKTTDEAVRNAIEAARAWAEDARADGEPLPRPRSIDALRKDREVSTARRPRLRVSGGALPPPKRAPAFMHLIRAPSCADEKTRVIRVTSVVCDNIRVLKRGICVTR